MISAGIFRAPLLAEDDDDEVPSISQRPQSTFEDGTLVTSGVHPTLRGPFNPYRNYAEPPPGLGSANRQSPAPNSSQMVQSPPVIPPPASRVYRERTHTPPSSSQGHESQSHNSHEPLAQSSGSTLRLYIPSLYPLLGGSFPWRDMSTLQTSSEESYTPPVPPPHILTSFGPPQPEYTSVQMGSSKRNSYISDYTQHGDEEGHALSPLLDSRLEERLREGDGSQGSVGLHDSEDYSARPRLEVRARNFFFCEGRSKYNILDPKQDWQSNDVEMKLPKLTEIRLKKNMLDVHYAL